jgi:arsenate reductase-like glutaredoxin family protein
MSDGVGNNPQPRVNLHAGNVGQPPNLPLIPQQGDVQPNVQQQRVGLQSPEMRDQRRRRWSIEARAAFGLPDVKGQNLIMASSVATCARIDDVTLRPGTSAGLANVAVDNDQDWLVFLQQLQLYENLPLPRETQQGQALKQAAQQAAVTAGNTQPPDQAKLNAISDALSALKAFELRDRVLAKGNPPWGARDAQEATQAKVELDMLSIPANQRTMTVQGGGVNPSFWVQRSSPEENHGPERSFLCKPASTTQPDLPIPVGGEVAREALSGRVATMLRQVMRFDVDMPETHVVTLPSNYFPGGPPQGHQQGPITCSVQEAKKADTDIGKAKGDRRDAIPPSQCASIAFMDLISLNVDRHRENLLIDRDGKLVPIDHGGSFPNDNAGGKQRLSGTMSGPHNVLLRLAGTHAQITDDMAQSLRNIDPQTLRAQLAQERHDMGQDNAISDGSLDMSLAAARFIKLAGNVTGKDQNTKQLIRLSPAAIQVAFGANASELLAFPPPTDDQAAAPFDERAIEILKQALADQATIQQVCMMENSTYRQMVGKLKTLRWDTPPRGVGGDAPAGVGADAAICGKLIATKTACPTTPRVRVGRQLAKARELLQGQAITPKEVGKAIAGIEMRTLKGLAELLGEQSRTLLRNQSDDFKKSSEVRRAQLRVWQERIVDSLIGTSDQLKKFFIFPDEFIGFRHFGAALDEADYEEAHKRLNEMIGWAKRGEKNIVPRQGR